MDRLVQLGAVFLYTNSSVTNFAPENALEKSSRILTGFQLFPPFCTFPVNIMSGGQQIVSSDSILRCIRWSYHINEQATNEHNEKKLVQVNPLIWALVSRPIYSSQMLILE